MNLRQLQHFITLVDCGDYSSAARKANITQPALSRSIKALEESFGKVLIDRRARSRGAFPTVAGRVFYEHATKLVNDLQRIRSELKNLDSESRGTVSIGVSPLFPPDLVRRVIERAERELPDIHIFVHEGHFYTHIFELAAGRIDFILTTVYPKLTHDRFSIEELFDIHSVIVAGTKHSVTRRKGLSLPDLFSYKWAGYDQIYSAGDLGLVLPRVKVPAPTSSFRTTSIQLIKELVAKGTHLAFLPEYIVSREIAWGLMKPLQLSRDMLYVPKASLCYPRKDVRTATVSLVMSLIRDECAKWEIHSRNGR